MEDKRLYIPISPELLEKVNKSIKDFHDAFRKTSIEVGEENVEVIQDEVIVTLPKDRAEEFLKEFEKPILKGFSIGSEERPVGLMVGQDQDHGLRVNKIIQDDKIPDLKFLSAESPLFMSYEEMEARQLLHYMESRYMSVSCPLCDVGLPIRSLQELLEDKTEVENHEESKTKSERNAEINRERRKFIGGKKSGRKAPWWQR